MITEKMKTKDKIMEVALQLFSEKGFAGVSVRDIAKEVGVRESALYKHYKNKQDILDSIIEKMRNEIEKEYIKQQVPEAIRVDVAQGYRELSIEQLKQISWSLFCMYTKNIQIANYRKLLMREMLCNSQRANLYSDIFLLGVIDRQKKTFEKLTEGEFFRKEDSEIIALQFYGPIFMLFQEYDCHPEREEQIKLLLQKHVEVFGRNFKR